MRPHGSFVAGPLQLSPAGEGDHVAVAIPRSIRQRCIEFANRGGATRCSFSDMFRGRWPRTNSTITVKFDELPDGDAAGYYFRASVVMLEPAVLGPEYSETRTLSTRWWLAGCEATRWLPARGNRATWGMQRQV